jgi:hypothetical protein
VFLACHKKSYLICDELTNFRIFTKPIPIIFSTYKTGTTKQGRDSCLKINKYWRFLTSRFCQIAFLMTCQQQKSRNQVKQLRDIYLPRCWVDLSFNSRVILDFILFWNCKLRNCAKNVVGLNVIYLNPWHPC